MFFLGNTQITLTRQTGDFYCPQCGDQRIFKLKVVRQFLTVYFIPLIPLQVVKEFVECTTCLKKYAPSTVGRDKASFEAMRQHQTLEVIRNVLVLIVAADDVVTDEELEAVHNFARKYQHTDITAEQILEEAAKIQQVDVNAATWIRRAGAGLSDEDKKLLVHHAFLVATANGELSHGRQGLLGQLPEALEMPDSLFREIITQAANS